MNGPRWTYRFEAIEPPVLLRLQTYIPTAALADASLHTLFATQQYKDVKIEHKNDRVEIAVVENPIVSDVTYVGNKEIASDKFKDIVKLKKGAIYTDAKAHADTYPPHVAV